MRQLFSRRYSAISTKDDNNFTTENKHRHYQKSLNAKRTFNKGFCILDSFFQKRKTGSKTRSPKCTFLFMAIGILAITTAIIFQVFQPYELIFRWKLIFGEDGEIFNIWEKPPIDLYIKIYLFNITNPDEYLAGKEKMNVQEIGPYVYKEIMQHDDVEFNDNNTLSTRPRHPLVWQEEMSGGRKENDEVVMVNIALLSIAQVAAEKSYFFRLPINLLIRQTQSQPIVRMTAREFMFGYETSITTIGNTLLPDWIYFDKVGLIDRMYDFNSDYETMYTGEDDASKSGLYSTYCGSKDLQQWNGEHCSNIDMASDGIKFRSYLEPNDTVLFFRKSMCRPQRLIRTGDEVILQDLAGYKYVFEENALDNGYYNENNKCFCRKGVCQPRGLIDVTDCYYGFPISLSYPHFMEGDPKLLEDVDGMKPNRSLHESYFYIQPKSGLPLVVSVKFQINMHMRDVSNMANCERFSDITIPMLWFEIALPELPQPLLNRFKLYLNILPYIDVLGVWVFGPLGLIFLFVAILHAMINFSSILMQSKDKLCKNSNYDESNRSMVYKSCEVKLVDLNTNGSLEEVEIQRNDYSDHKDDPFSKKTRAEDEEFRAHVSESIDDYDDDLIIQMPNRLPNFSNIRRHSENIHLVNKHLERIQVIAKNALSAERIFFPRDENSSWKMGEASSLMEDMCTNDFRCDTESLVSQDDKEYYDDYETYSQNVSF